MHLFWNIEQELEPNRFILIRELWFADMNQKEKFFDSPGWSFYDFWFTLAIVWFLILIDFDSDWFWFIWFWFAANHDSPANQNRFDWFDFISKAYQSRSRIKLVRVLSETKISCSFFLSIFHSCQVKIWVANCDVQKH